MPQASDELRARWDGPSDEKAIAFLKERGFHLTPHFFWLVPDGKRIDELTEEENSAITFLIHEWDFGGPILYPTNETSTLMEQVRDLERLAWKLGVSGGSNRLQSVCERLSLRRTGARVHSMVERIRSAETSQGETGKTGCDVRHGTNELQGLSE